MSAVTEALRDGVATGEDLARLERWSVVLRGRVPARRWMRGRTWRPACCRRSRKWSIATNNDCDSCRAGAFKAVRPYEIEAVMTA